MNRTLALIAALGAGLTTANFATAQASAATPPAAARPAPAAPAAATPVAAQAIPAKIALVNFQQVVLASNEGQVVTANTQKKFEPRKNQIEALATEVDTLKKNLQSAPATLSDEDKAKRLRDIDTKEKQLNRDAEDAQTAYNTEWQEGLEKVAQKIASTMRDYAKNNGYTILFDVGGQQSNVLWAADGEDISQAVVDAYNKQSGIAAPPPQSPRATTPRPSTAPKTTTPAKPPAK